MKKTQGKSVKITLKKSGIGCPQDQRQTLVGLGLRKLNSISVLKDSPSVRGMIYKVCHLVSVENV
ncbi:MAG TPA: 50S ribosomal protein L30 [Thermodesulfobacteriota bacterium]|uniref:50S ribosomal protein L30 n=1 Tax=uncultured delta proteobacterium Rifle_16ft_4_minimus_37851 TaxID=1665181 RepID=A0A0H4T956_9DELT|nr:50S ribosomal protein L30, large subunit ribosomal protein L30 [uncultured delta proteobacterium Rifle_16ft_4_minimus_37851]HZX35547.1 50S ribosomal protein L30 [Thermodesulfobacteriota bacterium]